MELFRAVAVTPVNYIQVNSSVTAVTNTFLIQDLLINIFHYLDFKSLLLCKSVNKQWLSDACHPSATKHTIIVPKMIKKIIIYQAKRNENIINTIKTICHNDNCLIKLILQKYKQNSNTIAKQKLMNFIYSLQFHNCGTIVIDHHLLSIEILIPLLCYNYNYNYDTLVATANNNNAVGSPVLKSRIRRLHIVAGSSSRENDVMGNFLKVLNKIYFDNLKYFNITLIRGLLYKEYQNRPYVKIAKYKIINMTSDDIYVFNKYEPCADEKEKITLTSRINDSSINLVSKFMVWRYHVRCKYATNKNSKLRSTNQENSDQYIDKYKLNKYLDHFFNCLEYRETNYKKVTNKKAICRFSHWQL